MPLVPSRTPDEQAKVDQAAAILRYKAGELSHAQAVYGTGAEVEKAKGEFNQAMVAFLRLTKGDK